MQHLVTVPLLAHPPSPELFSRRGLLDFARRAEELGVDAVGLTDHPAPSHRWLTHGGHDAVDPFATFGAMAAVTERLLLIPNILVLPYRNPFVVAKGAATLDLLSEGRFVLSVATGYLRGEYAALGVDFDERNRLFDEALDVIAGIWASDDFAYDGLHFTARGQTANPKPTKIPVWIGGNSALTRRRVAARADGWAPFAATKMLSQTAKTPPLETLDDLVPMLDHLWQHVDEAGRERKELDVAVQALGCTPPGSPDFEPEQHLDTLGRLADLGVTWTGTSVPGDSLAAGLDALEQYATDVIAPLRGG